MKVDIAAVKIQMACKDLTGTALAAQAGIARPTLSMILHGKDCAASTIVKIARALDCDPADLIKKES